jgi:hypothetical protein
MCCVLSITREELKNRMPTGENDLFYFTINKSLRWEAWTQRVQKKSIRSIAI